MVGQQKQKRSRAHMNADFFKTLAAAAAGDRPAWLTTVVTTTGSTPARIGMKMIVRADSSITGTIGGGELEKAVVEKIRAELPATAQKWSLDLGSHAGAELTTTMTCGGVQEILVEPLSSGTPLVIFGGGHCGAALSFLATWAGFTVTVVDNREEWASRSKHPAAARTVCRPYENLIADIEARTDTYFVIMTHGHEHDGVVLRQLLDRPWAYLGMIGSKAKVRELFDSLRSDGVGEERLARVSAPIGVPIASHTPEEIAVSIVAQMIAVRNGASRC
jgi:xanthine dehydrogenase accessory factor